MGIKENIDIKPNIKLRSKAIDSNIYNTIIMKILNQPTHPKIKRTNPKIL